MFALYVAADQRVSIRGSVFPMPVYGCVLTVEHPAVLGRGEAAGYFTQSVIYTGQAYSLYFSVFPQQDTVWTEQQKIIQAH